jgi:hypothetical protein
MRGSFIHHRILKKRKMRKRNYILTAVLLACICLLSACGPEPGAGEGAGQDSGAMFGGKQGTGETAKADKDDRPGDPPVENSAEGLTEETAAADTVPESDSVGMGRTGSPTAATAAAAEDVFGRPMQGEITETDDSTLEELQLYLNEDSSYGFLLSSYDIPEDIDLNQVFFSGAGFAQEKLTEKEKELLLDRIPQKEIRTPVVKVTDEQIEELLSTKAGISYEDSRYPLTEEHGWARIRRYNSWYALRGDTNRKYIRCTDAWQQGDVYIVHYQLLTQAPGEENDESALYRPTYEVQLEKKGDGYRFCYNIVWTQKDLIEAQSYRAELKPAGEVFFAPYYPDTDRDEKADVTFVLEKDRAILDILSPVEKGNIRTDLVFDGVDAVDFTDYNGDDCTDILTVCSYTQIGEDGRKTGSLREARVYTGQEEGVPLLDSEKTEAVNRDVEVLNITNMTAYLTGKSDGAAKTYSSWKEAFADHIRGIDEDEYDGFALIYLNDDRTPELVQVGATTAKGATIVVYRNGMLEETWLNRRDFQYLEYENLLYSPSGVENLHFDTIYSITGGELGISTQGYYGNSSLARVRFDKDGKEVWDYYWDGGVVSESGYRDGLNFIIDVSRAKTCDKEHLLTAEQLLEQLK